MAVIFSARMLKPLHRWVWRDAERRAHKLLRFGETETDGGRDLVRAAELTADPLLRRLYLAHAADELRHGEMFRRRGSEILLAGRASTSSFQADWLAPSGHGVDDLNVDGTDHTLLAFLHLSEKAAATRFAVYRDVLHDDLPTQKIFDAILHDEAFHMNYAFSQLARVSPHRHRLQLWRARLSRLWKSYVRLAAALGGVMGGLMLTIQYFIVLPPFAWLAKRAARREPPGWTPIAPRRNDSLNRQY
jgi:hypothetical protein